MNPRYFRTQASRRARGGRDLFACSSQGIRGGVPRENPGDSFTSAATSYVRLPQGPSSHLRRDSSSESILSDFFSFEELLTDLPDWIDGPPSTRSRDLSPSGLRRLSRVPGSAASSEECTICWVDFTQADQLIKLNCVHTFHEKCIENWLKQVNTCPVCRSQVNT